MKNNSLAAIAAVLVMNIFVALASYLMITDWSGVLIGTIFVGLCMFVEIMANMELSKTGVQRSLSCFTFHTICAVIVFSLAIYSGKINGFEYENELGHGNYGYETVPAWHWYILAGLYGARVIWQVIFTLIYYIRRK